MARLKKLKSWYDTYERRISVGSLFTGFLVDSLTLQSIDALRENLWIALNMVVVGLCIIFLNRPKSEKKEFWLSNILQFSFGALLGSFFIFYFRSTTLSATWPFLAVLLFAMFSNELFQKRYAKLVLQISFLYFSIFSFSIFLTPLVINRIGPEVFIFSGAISILLIWIFLGLLGRFAREKFLESRTVVWLSIIAVFVGVNILYFTNLIPPIPIALKDSGVYYSLVKSPNGDYVVEGEERGFTKYFTLWPKIYWKEGEPIYVYTAIFSPGSLNTDIVHEWQYKNGEGKWVTVTRMPLYLSGGRSAGFRTYSNKYNFTPGLWRVDVKTPKGQIIGRVNFEVVLGGVVPPLTTFIK